MSKFIKSMSLFAMATPLLISRSADASILKANIDNKEGLLDPVSMRPLNYETDNLYAGHRSHSSHSSHSSHYSGSGGGYSSSGGYSPSYTPPVYRPTPVYTPTAVYTPPKSTYSRPSTIPKTTPSYTKPNTYKSPSSVYIKPQPAYRPSTVINQTAPRNTDWDRPSVTTVPNPYPNNLTLLDNQDEVLQQVNQIKRVQMVLLRLGYYNGRIDGSLGQQTRDALIRYQTERKLESTGRMTTETLNSMGIIGTVFSE